MAVQYDLICKPVVLYTLEQTYDSSVCSLGQRMKEVKEHSTTEFHVTVGTM